MSMVAGRGRAKAEINVTPLVDVVLVLLIIFMVLTPLAERQMAMRVPELATQPQPAPSDSTKEVVMLVRPDGRVLLNREDMPISEAMARLRAAFLGRASRVLFLGADDVTKYELVVHVADEARKAGVITIALTTERAPDVP